jgi:hypothetical protein
MCPDPCSVPTALSHAQGSLLKTWRVAVIVRSFLKHQDGDKITVTFEDLENADRVGIALPASAKRYVQWRANESTSASRQCCAWLDSGWEVAAVNLTAERITFRRRK